MAYADVILSRPSLVAYWPMTETVVPIAVAFVGSSQFDSSTNTAKAFDADPNTQWTTAGTSTGWLRAELNAAAVLTSYGVAGLAAAFPDRSPKDWTFEGSNDGTTWDVLDTRVGVSWATNAAQWFDFANSTAYLYYRINVTANHGGVYLNIVELFLATMADGSGNGRRGALYNVTPTTGLVTDGAGALGFNGVNTSAQVPNAAWMDTGIGLTFEAWIKTTATGYREVAALYTSSGSRAWEFRLDSGSGALNFIKLSGGTTSSIGTTNLRDGNRHHVVATYDGSSNIRLYVDGVLEKTTAASGSITSSGAWLGVGERSSDLWFDGTIGHVAMYGAALSGAEVAENYAAGTASGDTIALGTATRTTTAHPLTVDNPTTIPLGVASRASTVHALTTLVDVDVPLGVATRTTTTVHALTVTVGVTTIPLGVATRTSEAHPLTVDAPAVVTLGTITRTSAVHAVTVDDHTVTVVPLGTATRTVRVWPLGVRGGAVGTNRSDRYNGLHLRGTGTATWEPPVVEPPATVVEPHAVVRAAAITSTMTTESDGYVRPIVTRTEATRQAARTRIIIGGKDVTYWRGRRTPNPTYHLVQPLSYGSARIELPQFHHLHEPRPRWLRRNAIVKVQRVNVATGAVIATDYRGVIIDFDASDGFAVECGGEVIGPLALDRKPQELFRRVQDIGWMVAFGVRDAGARFLPWPATMTGIEMVRPGGMDRLAYIQELLAKAYTVNGEQWTVSWSQGAYRLAKKDRTTVDATIYFDNKRVVPSIRSDITEEPNKIYAQGVGPAGMRIRFGVYPNLVKAEPAPYPFNDGRTFGQGTEDADTDTGDGISVMVNRLMTAGYLAVSDVVGGYDADAADAVRDLQHDAGLTETGTMTAETWGAMYDQGTTGYDVAYSHIGPAAQAPHIGKFRRSASGQVARLNPAYDPNGLVVAREYDMGAGFTKGQIRRFAAAKVIGKTENVWTGTVTLTGESDAGYGLIAGEHIPGDPVATGDVMNPRAIRPGMNVWAPLWDDGTLFHVSGVEVSESGVQLLLDTHARDTMEAWQVIQRNRGTRRDPARAWLSEQRQSNTIQDAVYGFDEVGGLVDERALKGGEWNIFPVVGGQEGTIRRLRLALTPACEFAVAVFGRRVQQGFVDGITTAPLTEDGVARWDEMAARLDDKVLLFAGPASHEQPYGYHPRAKTGDDGEATGAPLTGVMDDRSQFSYHTFADPVLWVAVWPDRDTVLPAGRIVWPQLESGA